MDNENAVHIYNGMLFSHIKNEIIAFSVAWMDLGTVILNEVKDKYHMI